MVLPTYSYVPLRSLGIVRRFSHVGGRTIEGQFAIPTTIVGNTRQLLISLFTIFRRNNGLDVLLVYHVGLHFGCHTRRLNSFAILRHVTTFRVTLLSNATRFLRLTTHGFFTTFLRYLLRLRARATCRVVNTCVRFHAHDLIRFTLRRRRQAWFRTFSILNFMITTSFARVLFRLAGFSVPVRRECQAVSTRQGTMLLHTTTRYLHRVVHLVGQVFRICRDCTHANHVNFTILQVNLYKGVLRGPFNAFRARATTHSGTRVVANGGSQACQGSSNTTYKVINLMVNRLYHRFPGNKFGVILGTLTRTTRLITANIPAFNF